MRVRIRVLGQFSVTVGDAVIASEAWRRERGAAVVKLLAVSPGHRLHREQMMELFWSDLDPEAAGANLRKAIHFARRSLGEHRLLETSGDVIALAPNDELVIDSEQFELAAQQALETQAPADCERAANLYAGTLLPDDRYVEWLEEPRKELEERYARVLKAGKLWERLVRLDPANEQAQCALMQAALDAGDRGEVIRLFQRLRERLRLDLGVGPKAATVALYERALALSEVAPSSVVERVRASLAWGLVHLHSGELEKAERIARETREVALGADLAREVGECTALLGQAAHLQGRFQEVFRAEFSEWVRKPGGAPQIFDAHLCLTQFCLCGVGGHVQIGAAARELYALAEQADSDPGRALATLCMGEAELFSGHIDEAARLLRDSEQLHERTHGTAGHVMTLQRLAEVELSLGHLAQADELVRRALVVVETTWLNPHLLIRLLGLLVQTAPTFAQAEGSIARGDQMLADGSSCHPCSMGFRVASTIALAEAGELERVGRRIDEAERLSGMWGGGPWVAALWEARGVQRRAQGNEERAQAAFGEAADRFAELGRELDERRCRARSREKSVLPGESPRA
jgi:DNA-binding SARP family transcriptional activator